MTTIEALREHRRMLEVKRARYGASGVCTDLFDAQIEHIDGAIHDLESELCREPANANA